MRVFMVYFTFRMILLAGCVAVVSSIPGLEMYPRAAAALVVAEFLAWGVIRVELAIWENYGQRREARQHG